MTDIPITDARALKKSDTEFNIMDKMHALLVHLVDETKNLRDGQAQLAMENQMLKEGLEEVKKEIQDLIG
jgi:transcriptional regulator with GAF, ATPase, and Fis domain